MTIHFVVYCETFDWWWKDCTFVPRVGDIVHYAVDFKVIEVRWEWKDEVVITVDRVNEE